MAEGRTTILWAFNGVHMCR